MDIHTYTTLRCLVRNILPMLIKVLADAQTPWGHLKKKLTSLEQKMLHNTDFRLAMSTPVTSLHPLLQQAVSKGVLRQHSIPTIGATAADVACRCAVEELGVCYHASEIAAAALFLAVLQERGPNTAANVAVVTGCNLDCPRFLWLCRRTKSWVGATTNSANSAGVQVFTHEINRAGESDIDSITPLPSVDVQDQHGGFFQSGQVRGLLVRLLVA